MAAAAPFIMAGMQVADGIMSRDAAYKGSRVHEENARQSLLAGEVEAQQVRREARQQNGDALAAMGGSGLMLTGSITDMLEQGEYEAELDIIATRRRATGQARNYSQQAKDMRRQGRNAMIGGIFGAASTVLGAAREDRRDKIARENADTYQG